MKKFLFTLVPSLFFFQTFVTAMAGPICPAISGRYKSGTKIYLIEISPTCDAVKLIVENDPVHDWVRVIKTDGVTRLDSNPASTTTETWPIFPCGNYSASSFTATSWKMHEQSVECGGSAGACTNYYNDNEFIPQANGDIRVNQTHTGYCQKNSPIQFTLQKF